jgi:type I restriction enzyme, S subunit
MTGNNIPKHWEQKSIKEAFEIAKEKGAENSVPYLEIGDIDINTKSYILKSKPAVKGCKISKNGDLLISRVRPTRGAIVQIKEEIIPVSSAFTILRNKNTFFDSFPFYFFAWNNEFHNYLGNNCSGSLYPTVSESILIDYKILIPPYKEQELIVSKIEELLSELDNGINQLQTAHQQLKVYRQSLLKWAFEGKLTNKKVVDGELPKDWKLSQLGEVTDMCLGKMLDRKKNKGNYQPYLRNISVRWGQFDLSDLEEMRFEPHEEERYSLKNGDLIVCEGGEPGRCAIWKGAVPNMKIQKALHRVRVKKMLSEIYLYHFMYYSAMSGLLNKYFTGTTIKHLTGRELKKIEIPLPPIKEQQLIVDELESKLTVCDKIEETISQSLQQAEILRQSILKKAFEGKLV